MAMTKVLLISGFRGDKEERNANVTNFALYIFSIFPYMLFPLSNRKSAAGLVNRECNLIGTLPNKRHSSEHAHWRISNVPSLNEKR